LHQRLSPADERFTIRVEGFHQNETVTAQTESPLCQ
jgi:hypothetical protein